MVFPAINMYHVKLSESDTEDETELPKEKEQVLTKIKRLEQENKLLLLSTQNWMLKYQEADLNDLNEQKDYTTSIFPLLTDKLLSD